MTTQPQRTPWALAREASGLLLSSLGALGVLTALGALHWAAGLIAAMLGLIGTGFIVRSSPRPMPRVLGTAVAGIGYSGLTACVFVLCAPIGWLCVSLAVVGAGVLLSSGESTEGT